MSHCDTTYWDVLRLSFAILAGSTSNYLGSVSVTPSTESISGEGRALGYPLYSLLVYSLLDHVQLGHGGEGLSVESGQRNQPNEPPVMGAVEGDHLFHVFIN